MAVKNKFMVTAAFSDQYKVGAALKTEEQIANYFRALFSFGKEPPQVLTLTDSEIVAIVDHIDNVDDAAEADNARLDALEKAVDVLPTLSAVGNTVKASGMAFGKSLPESFDTIMATGLKGQADVDAMPMSLAFILDKALPRNANGQISAPFPGVPETETVKDRNGHETVIKHENPDRFVLKTGTTREMSSYYLEAFKLRPGGQRILATLAQIDGTNDAPASVDHPEFGETTTVIGYKSMRAKDRTGERTKWKARLDNGAEKLRRAAKICFKCEAIRSMDRIEMTLVSKPQEGAPELTLAGLQVLEAGRVFVTDSKKPIMLMDARVKGSMTDPMSVTSFLQIDPASVPASATLETLLETVARGTPSATPAGAADVASLSAGDTKGFGDYVAEVTAFIEDAANFRLLLADATNKKLSDEVVHSMHILEDALGAINLKTQGQFTAYAARIDAEAKAEDKAKQAALKNVG